MTLIPNQEDRGIQSDINDPLSKDRDNDGFVEDGLGNPAAPEDSGTGGAGGD
ncbi:MAG: hypothetical protein KBD06_02600 [Candidatus Pacebacteria bacterium]|nr:hypothetical protein [Candidatus Paceibacterota bacterium]